jgi:hypothetical protein
MREEQERNDLEKMVEMCRESLASPSAELAFASIRESQGLSIFFLVISNFLRRGLYLELQKLRCVDGFFRDVPNPRQRPASRTCTISAQRALGGSWLRRL